MPIRMLRDWTLSDKVDEISCEAERFFTRLIMKVDDYGCFYADTRIIKANLFPLKLDRVREADLLRWMAECQNAGLIVLYESDQKKYLQIIDFKQRLDKARSKFPLPHTNIEFREVVNELPAETEYETETETDVIGASPPEQTPFFRLEKKQKDFYSELIPYTATYGKDMVRLFYDYWREPNKSKTRMKWESEKTWDLVLRLKRWDKNNFSKSVSTSITSTKMVM
jgi:hypothetical protein